MRENFVLRYRKGRHLKKRVVNIKVDGSTSYKVEIAILFLPLQLHEEERKFRQTIRADPQLIIPYGGDIFSLFTDGPLLDFFVMDVSGHGLFCRGLSRQLIRYATLNRKRVDIIEQISHKWEGDKANLLNEAERQLREDIEKARGLGYHPSLIGEYLRKLEQGPFEGIFVSACQSIIDLRKKAIYFRNFGHPSQYCLLVLPNGKTWLKSFSPDTSILMSDSKLPKISGKFFQIPRGVNNFRLVLFSDAILEQVVKIDHSNHVNLLSQLEDPKLKRRYHQAMTRSFKDRRATSNLLVYTIRNTAKKPPEQVAKFFYDYLLGLNQETQGDDITFAVIDFKRKP